MLPETTLDEALRKMVKDYIDQNLTVEVRLETNYSSEPYAVEVTLSLEGHEISSDRSVF